MHEDTEKRIRLLKDEWQEQMESTVANRTKQIEEASKKQLEDGMKAQESERARSIKLETTKWKQVVKDLENRYELEITEAKKKGYSDKDNEAKIELHEVTTKCGLKVQQLTDLHNAFVSETQKDKELMEADHEKEVASVKQDTA